MDGDEVNVAAIALLKELVNPVETSVGNSRGTKLGVASEGLHVLLPSSNGLRDSHGGLVRAVRLVKTQQVARTAVVEPVPSIVPPLSSVIVLSAPEHGNELSKALLLAGRTVPVVLPVHLGGMTKPLATKLPNGDIVVGSKTSLGPVISQNTSNHDRAGQDETRRNHCKELKMLELDVLGSEMTQGLTADLSKRTGAIVNFLYRPSRRLANRASDRSPYLTIIDERGHGGTLIQEQPRVGSRMNVALKRGEQIGQDGCPWAFLMGSSEMRTLKFGSGPRSTDEESCRLLSPSLRTILHRREFYQCFCL